MMTNLQSIAGGVAWMLVSALLAGAALEPVSVKNADMRSQIELAAACADSAAPLAKACESSFA